MPTWFRRFAPGGIPRSEIGCSRKMFDPFCRALHPMLESYRDSEAPLLVALISASLRRMASSATLRSVMSTDRADDLFVAGFVPHAMCEIVKMLDRTIRHQQPMLVVKVTSALRGTLERVFDEAHIVRMRSLQYQLGRWFRSGGIPVNPRRLVGPKYSASCLLPFRRSQCD